MVNDTNNLTFERFTSISEVANPILLLDLVVSSNVEKAKPTLLFFFVVRYQNSIMRLSKLCSNGVRLLFSLLTLSYLFGLTFIQPKKKTMQ